jgi:hypothetical protein
MQIATHGTITAEVKARIQAEVSSQQNLKDMMAWALSQGSSVFLPGVVSEVIVQDEFTHDVIVPRSDGLVLVYDTT